MSRVDIVVVTRNEAKHIRACLDSARLLGSVLGEIILVDDASSDDTAAIAAAQGARVIVHPHDGENWDLNKNVGMAAGLADWVLLVDADERVTPALATALQAFVAAPQAAAGYWLPRREFYFGFHAAHAASGARVLRLFRRGAATFEGDRLHAHPTVDGPLGDLEAPLDHLAYDTIAAYVDKTNRYTDHEAKVRYAAGERVRGRDIVLGPLRLFRHRYWNLRGYKDGMPGLVYAVVTSLYPLLQNLKLWELAEAKGNRPA